MLIFLARMISENNEVGCHFVGVEIDNGTVTHESEAQAFSPECTCVVNGSASCGWVGNDLSLRPGEGP
jgi:hypothetical protein